MTGIRIILGPHQPISGTSDSPRLNPKAKSGQGDPVRACALGGRSRRRLKILAADSELRAVMEGRKEMFVPR